MPNSLDIVSDKNMTTYNPLNLFPDGPALNLTHALRGRRRCCVLIPGLDVFVEPKKGKVILFAERQGDMDTPARMRDLLPLLKHCKALGFTLRRVRPKNRSPRDILIEATRPETP